MKQRGQIFLIPTFLSDDNAATLPESVIKIAHSLVNFAVEDEKSVRRFLKRINIPHPQDQLTFFLINEHEPTENIPAVMKMIEAGHHVGVLSEAGCPGIADPGSELVKQAHEKGIRVNPLVGPSSIYLSLMASGFNGQSFVFHGYLPREHKQRQLKMKEMERQALKSGQTQIFIETPYRNMQVLEDLLNILDDDTSLCIASEISSQQEKISSRTIKVWKKAIPALNKKACVFLIGA